MRAVDKDDSFVALRAEIRVSATLVIGIHSCIYLKIKARIGQLVIWWNSICVSPASVMTATDKSGNIWIMEDPLSSGLHNSPVS